jgi:hypothetical protein
VPKSPTNVPGWQQEKEKQSPYIFSADGRIGMDRVIPGLHQLLEKGSLKKAKIKEAIKKKR